MIGLQIQFDLSQVKRKEVSFTVDSDDGLFKRLSMPNLVFEDIQNIAFS